MTQVRLIVLLAIVLAGCREVLDLDSPVPDAGAAYDRCAPAPFDPLRYQTIYSGAFAGLGRSWGDARRACQLVGMDLVVFNDEHELGRAPVEGWPYWFGVSQAEGGTWQSVDDCPAMPLLAPQQGAQCGAVLNPLELSAVSCDGVMPTDPDITLAALCETPRPSDARCVNERLATKTYTVSTATLSFAAAKTFCMAKGEHLVVIDSFEELGAVSRLVRDQAVDSFWIGATFDGTQWSSATGCPPEFSWSDALPATLDARPSCVAATISQVFDEETSTTPTILQGMQVAGCDETRLALCESE